MFALPNYRVCQITFVLSVCISSAQPRGVLFPIAIAHFLCDVFVIAMQHAILFSQLV